MKQSAIENQFGVTLLSREEEIETSGGVIWGIVYLAAWVARSVNSIIQDLRDFMDGCDGAPHH